MIADLHHSIEQLDLAAEQLMKASPSYSRFALILTDNAIELLLHKYAAMETSWDSAFRAPCGRGKITDADRKALGSAFEEKPKFANRRGVISDLEAQFIRFAHHLRNEAYHQGLVHEAVIADIASCYHDLACELLHRIPFGVLSWSSSQKVPPVVKKYCGDDGLTFDPEAKIQPAAKALSAAKPKMERSLGEALYAAALARIEATDSNIEFLSSEMGEDRDAIIFSLQATDFLQTEEAEPLIAADGITIDYDEAMRRLRLCWRPKMRHDPLSPWMGRVEAIRSEACRYRAAERYRSLMQDMESLHDAAQRAAIALDRAIDLQIDAARGK